MRIDKIGLRLLVIIIFLLSSHFLYGSDQLKVNSQWRDCEIVVDGRDIEWPEKVLVKKDEISIGVLNDKNYIYVCFISQSREIDTQLLELLGQSFTVWFDPDGGQNRTFGLCLSLGIKELFGPEMGRNREPDLAELKKALENSQKKIGSLKVLVPGKEPSETFVVPEVHDIYVKMEFGDKKLVYELKIPLTQDKKHHYAIETKAGQIIGLGFETSKIDQKLIGDKMPGRRPPDDQGMPPGGTQKTPECFQLWTTIKLASGS